MFSPPKDFYVQINALKSSFKHTFCVQYID